MELETGFLTRAKCLESELQGQVQNLRAETEMHVASRMRELTARLVHQVRDLYYLDDP